MTITTVEELEALPHSAIVTDNRAYAWQKVSVQTDELPDLTTLWLSFGSKTGRTTARVAEFGPFEVLSDGKLTTSRTLNGIAVEGPCS